MSETGEGLKPRLTLVFCPEKEILLKTAIGNSRQEEDEEIKERESSDNRKAIIKVITRETLIEEEALKQLNAASRLKGCTHAFGMPDLHPGKGIPIGASIVTQGVFYPELVDYDIGCGMSFLKTGIPVNKLTQKRLEQLSSSLKSIDCPWSSKSDVI
jgi:RNA-splicing ligase RtcB